MDTPINRRRVPRWIIVAAGGGLLLAVAAAAWAAIARFADPAVAADRLSVAPVVAGIFLDEIPLRARAAPRDTVLLDAQEGGRIERKLVDDGAVVTRGQPLLTLSNTALQLEVIRSEAEVTSQLNALRSLEIQLARNNADNRRALNEIEWQLKKIADKRARDEKLAGIGFIAPAVMTDSRDEEQYWRNRRNITEESQRADEILQTSQLGQLRTSARQLQENLKIARGNLDALTVRAPVAGQLTAFDVTLGQSLTRGQRVGQIDSPDAFKLIATVDEHYLARVAIGQDARCESEANPCTLRVSKINPQVKGGQFEVELSFSNVSALSLRRGQSVALRLTLGAPRPALVLPVGPFLEDNGGKYVFVKDGDRAQRRNVTLGQRNNTQVELIHGVGAGEQVVTSSYANFATAQQIRIAR